MKTNKMQIEMASKQEVSDWQWRIIDNLRESHAGIVINWGLFHSYVVEIFLVFPAARADWCFLHKQKIHSS